MAKKKTHTTVTRLEADKKSGADPEDPDEYRVASTSGRRTKRAIKFSSPLTQGKGQDEGGVDHAKDTLGRVYEYFLSQFNRSCRKGV